MVTLFISLPHAIICKLPSPNDHHVSYILVHSKFPTPWGLGGTCHPCQDLSFIRWCSGYQLWQWSHLSTWLRKEPYSSTVLDRIHLLMKCWSRITLGMWSQGNTPLWMVGMQTCIAIMEINMTISQKIGNALPSYTQTTLHHTRRTLAQPCSLWLYS